MPSGLSPAVSLAISSPLLASIVATFGAPTATSTAKGSKRRGVSADSLPRFLFTAPQPPKLARLLPLLTRFASLPGHRAVLEALRAVGDPRATSWLALSAADVAATLALARATSKGPDRRRATRVIELAQLRLDRELPETPTNELLARAPFTGEDAAVEKRLRRVFGDRVVDIWSARDPDGSRPFALFVRQPALAPLVFQAGAVAARAFAPVAVDLVHVSPGGARVRVTTASPELLPSCYVDGFDLALRPSFTLKPLHDLTSESLARLALPLGVRAVTVVALRRRTPDGARAETRARDVLLATDSDAAASAGYVDRATIRVDLGDRTVDAFLQLPHRLEISDPSAEPEVRGALAALGLFDPGALPDDARSLAPYTHPEWRWRAVLGDEAFDALVRAKLLTKVTVAHVATEALRMHGTSYVVRAIPGAKGTEYALAEDRAYGARLVTPDDRVAWRLDLDALAAAMRAALGAAKVDRAGALAIAGVIDAGMVTLKSGKLRFVYAMATPAKGWLEAARRACGIGVTLVVMVPRGHTRGLDGVCVVELDLAEQLGAKGVGRALGRAAEALDVGHEVEPFRRCDEDLVIDAPTERVWAKGVLVPLSDAPYRLVLALGRAGKAVLTKELGAAASSSGYPDVVARKAKARAEQQIASALRDAGGDPRIAAQLIVAEGRSGYRLAVSARVFEA